MTARVLFANAELEVRHVPAADASRHVVTFDRYHDDRTLARPGFGEDFFARHGITATHVLTRDNDWFQYPWLSDALDAIRAATAGAADVMAYGSSMGGYAAVRFADAVGAHRVLALSPQYSIDPQKMPSEIRWAQDMRRLCFLPEVDGPIRGGVVPVLAYDPWCPDGEHADRIADDISVVRLRVPFAGHLAAAYLSQAGLLTGLVMGTLDGTLDAAAVGCAVRRARRVVPTYYCGLAMQQSTRRPNLAVALAQQAVQLAPDAPDPHHALALCLSAAGRFAEAVAAHRRVVELDRGPALLVPFSYDLSRAGDHEGALAVAHEVLQALPSYAGIRSWLAELHQVQGDLPGALAYAGQALALDPDSEHYQAHVAALTAVLHPPPPEPEPPPPPPPPPPPRVLFQSADVLVRHVPAPRSAGDGATRHVVTFDCYHDERTLDRPGFGETFFRDHGITATHVLTRDNDWFQHPEMAEATAAIRAVTAGAAAVLAYGSSMGGYAAVRFADAVGAGQALALSPQYSIDPARAPFERRWGQDRRRLRFLPGIDGPIRSAVRPVVAYDPHGPDRPHADRIAADTPIIRLAIPHGGHPVGSLLSEAGLLTGIVMQALDGTLDPAETGRAIRARRHSLSAYFGALASRQPASRPRLAIALAERAVQLAPERPDTHHALALRLSAAGRFEAAVAAHEQVAALERHPGYLMDFSYALHAAGDSAGALAVAHEVRAAWPHHGGVHHWISDVLRAQGDLSGALHFAQRAAALDPASELYRRTAAMLQAKLRPWSPRSAARFAWLRARRLLTGGQADAGRSASPPVDAGVVGGRRP